MVLPTDRVIYVDRQWRAQLMEYMPPDTRWVDEDTGGICVWVIPGTRLVFVDEAQRPVEDVDECGGQFDWDGDE